MPLATAAPGPSIEPPLALTPFTVSNGRMVSKSHSSLPVLASCARRWPSVEVAKTTPGMLDTAPGWEGLQPAGASLAQGAGATRQSLAPSLTRSAVRPPPLAGSRVKRRVSSALGVWRVRCTSETAA